MRISIVSTIRIFIYMYLSLISSETRKWFTATQQCTSSSLYNIICTYNIQYIILHIIYYTHYMYIYYISVYTRVRLTVDCVLLYDFSVYTGGVRVLPGAYLDSRAVAARRGPVNVRYGAPDPPGGVARCAAPMSITHGSLRFCRL